jgi:membrane-bound lytic murein transglycosylase D
MNFLRLLLPVALAVLAGCASTQRDTASTPNNKLQYVAADTSRTVDLTRPPVDAWDRIRRGFAVPNLDTELTREWTEYYAAHPQSVQRMAERAGKYLYYIVDEINRRGLPTELALLPFVESAYNPTALSRSQASGLWQFIPTTGEYFNLKQDWWRDERRDPIASTNAALNYLEKLFEMQGDWYLALASYNWGEGSVQRAMAKNNAAGLPADYLSLNMPEETRNYVPKLQAIKNIIANPKKYSVSLPHVNNSPYFAMVPKYQDIDLDVAAKLAEMPLEEFKALNPSFNRPIIRTNKQTTLLLPADKVETFHSNLQAYKGALTTWQTYQPRRGESFAAIAKRFGISEAALRSANGIGRQTKSASGSALMIPAGRPGGVQLASLETPAAATVVAPPRAARTAAAPSRPNVRTHKVQSGDTLTSLAKRYGTSVTSLRALNNMKSNTLKVGTQLRIPGSGTRG